MYYCQATGKLVAANEVSHRLVTHIRLRDYFRKDKYDQDVKCGEGFETVREIFVSKEYHSEAMANGFKPEVVR